MHIAPPRGDMQARTLRYWRVQALAIHRARHTDTRARGGRRAPHAIVYSAR